MYKLFFGKISKKFDLKQIEEGYYQAPKSSGWFGDIQLGDYVYLIGGDKIQFWRAKEWQEVEGNDRLYFDILNNDLALSVNELTALKFLKLTKPLIVLTSRSARNKAFFKLELLNHPPIEELANNIFYKSADLYRKIQIIKDENFTINTEDIQLKNTKNGLVLNNAPFFDSSVSDLFRDNLKYQGQGSKLKDNTLARVKDGLKTNKIFSYEDLGMRSFYDAFFCDYKEKEKFFLVGAFWDDHVPQDLTETFVNSGTWENGYTDKFLEEVNSVAVGSYIAIKSAYTRGGNTAVIKIKARGRVSKNYNTGRHLAVIWEDNFMPFEVELGGYMNTIRQVEDKDHISMIWENETEDINTNDNDMEHKTTKLLRYKKQIILQGPPGTGKTREAKIIAQSLTYGTIEKQAQLTKDYLLKNLKVGQIIDGNYKNKYRISRISDNTIYAINDYEKEYPANIENIIRKARYKKYGYNPGGEVIPNAIAAFIDLKWRKEKGIDDKIKITQFHPTYTYEDFVRGITSKQAGDNKSIIYEAENKILTTFADKAKKDPDNNYVLIIDEINRANLSSVLGELIYALEYRDEEVESMYAVGGDNKLVLPPNLYIIGTMNTADRSVGHIDYAIRRRFAFVDVLPKDLSEDKSIKFHSQLFNEVSRLFIKNFDAYITNNTISLERAETLSGEFRPEDVWLGHSYFIQKRTEAGTLIPEDFSIRLEYEIKPILLEYVKDGILIDSAGSEKIEKRIKDLKVLD